MMYLIVFVLSLFVLYWYVTRNFNYWKKRNVPFLPPLPIVGNLLEGVLLKKLMGEILHDIYKKHKHSFLGIFVLNEPCLLVNDPELIKNILVTDFNYFYDRTTMDNKDIDPIASYILFILKNPDWKKVRKQIAPIFTTAKIKTMYNSMQKSSDDLLNYLNKRLENNNIIEIKEVFSKFTTDVISSTAFGVNSNCFKCENAQFHVISRRLFDSSKFIQSFSTRCYLIAPSLVKIFKLKFIDPFCTEFLKKAFWRIMQERETSQTERNDLIDILIQMKNSKDFDLDGDKLVAQAVQFFAAGFETTSSTASFALYELAKNPAIQQKLRDEIDKVYSKTGTFSYENLKTMPYLDTVIKETLRMYPILPFLDRRCNKNYNIPGTDVVIEKGIPIFIPILGLHYDPLYYPKPYQFDPDRFSSKNILKIPNYTYLAFGEGPRNCIGERFGMLTTKLAVALIVLKYAINVCEETPKCIKYDPKALVITPIDGKITLKLTKL